MRFEGGRMESRDSRPGSGSPSLSSTIGLDAEHPCDRLSKLARYIRLRGMDWNARTVAEALCHYFDTECRRHGHEQEGELFVALQQKSRDEESASTLDSLLA